MKKNYAESGCSLIWCPKCSGSNCVQLDLKPLHLTEKWVVFHCNSCLFERAHKFDEKGGEVIQTVTGYAEMLGKDETSHDAVFLEELEHATAP